MSTALPSNNAGCTPEVDCAGHVQACTEVRGGDMTPQGTLGLRRNVQFLNKVRDRSKLVHSSD